MNIWSFTLAGAFLAASLSIFAQGPSALELCEGAVVDVRANTVWLMNSDGKVEAIRLDTGALLWRSDISARPLGVMGNLLVCQAMEATANQLELLTLDAAGGTSISRDFSALPEGVQPMVRQGMGAGFYVRAITAGGQIYISWEYIAYPVSGLQNLPDRATLTAKGTGTGGTRSEKGIVAYNPQTRRIRSLTSAQLPPTARARNLQLPAGQGVSGIATAQFLSADDGFILVSERVADEREWKKYRWTIYDRVTLQPAGSFRNFQSRTPFVVHGKLLVYESAAYTLRSGDELLPEPRKIRAIDLATGREIWSREILETRYLGSFPP